MIEVRNVKPGGVRDILIFEVYLPEKKCLMLNCKMRINKSNKPYVVFPCMVEDREDGTKRYHRLTQFDQETEEALKKETLPRLRDAQPNVLSRFD